MKVNLSLKFEFLTFGLNLKGKDSNSSKSQTLSHQDERKQLLTVQSMIEPSQQDREQNSSNTRNSFTNLFRSDSF